MPWLVYLTRSQTLIHPYRPISVQYPPGELPPPNAIDELTGQILTYAFRSSSNDHGHGGWNHDWDATRRKLFELALAESKFGGDTATRKERATRPGLRRVDSMDFLDQEPVDKGSDKMGRALRYVPSTLTRHLVDYRGWRDQVVYEFTE